MNFPKIPIWLLVIIGIAGAFTILVLAGRITWFSTEPPLEFNPNMDHNFKAIPQSANTFFSNRSSLREPIPGTVARNVEVYPLSAGDIEEAETLNQDPGLDKNTFVLARGQNQFNVFCSPCHNFDGRSEGEIVKRGLWPGIPDLTREQTQLLSNARIFHIISAGQNLMPSYADKISPIDRWAIVYYLRTLQQRAGAGE